MNQNKNFDRNNRDLDNKNNNRNKELDVNNVNLDFAAENDAQDLDKELKRNNRDNNKLDDRHDR